MRHAAQPRAVIPSAILTTFRRKKVTVNGVGNPARKSGDKNVSRDKKKSGKLETISSERLSLDRGYVCPANG